MRGVRAGPPTLFRVEMKAAYAGARITCLRIGMTLLLGLPFVLIAMPLRVGATGLTMLITFTALFGAVVGSVRSREDGRDERLRLLPLPRWAVVGDTLLAGAAVDWLQVSPLLAAFIVSHGTGGSWAAVATVAGALSVSLLMLNGLGLAVAARVRSNAEAHLYGALTVAAVALLSGLVPTPERLRAVPGVTTPWSPLHYLAASLRAAGGEQMALPAWPLGCALVVFLAVCGLRMLPRR